MRFDGQASRDYKKLMRAQRLDSITVDVVRADGTVLRFDGDEESQKRLDRYSRRAIINGVESLPWTMADNTIQNVTPKEMEQALDLALQAQGDCWSI